MANGRANELFDLLKSYRHHYRPAEIVALFAKVDETRVLNLANALSTYIATNLPIAIERRDAVADYRTNPYVLMTSASVMKLGDPARFANFLFNNKLYMGLETSFGKSIEKAFVSQYPLNENRAASWDDPPEKLAEFAELAGLNREQRARRRTESVWREIDKSCVIGNRRYMTTIKSGPNCINDTQVQGMTRALIDNHTSWLQQSKVTYPNVTGIDVVVGITYGTDRTTNNKENQILIKLLDQGFEEEDRAKAPGVLIDSKTRSLRVYRRIGKDFWSFIGNPERPAETDFVFLEVLLALAKALAMGMAAADLETRINVKLQSLSAALGNIVFTRQSLPDWVREDFSEDQIFWFATAMTAFFDEGI
jgi:hypothetical protein